MSSEALRSIFVSELDELDRIELLRDCGINDDRPITLRRGNKDAKADEWIDRNAQKLIRYIFRYIDPPDDTVAELSEAKLIQISEQLLLQRTFKINFELPKKQTPTGIARGSGSVALNEIAGTGLALTELVIAIAAANRPFGIEPAMPSATVRSGSIVFDLSGGALAAVGLALVVACASGIVALPIALPVAVAGSAATILGLTSSVLDWRIQLGEERNLGLAADKTKLEIRKGQLELEKTEIELKLTRAQLAPARHAPPSSLVPKDEVLRIANQYGLSLPHAHHLLNRALPTAMLVNGLRRPITVSLPLHSPGRRGRGQAAKGIGTM
jgi:hypothetical protein